VSGRKIVTRRDNTTAVCVCACDHDKHKIINCWKCDCLCDPTQDKPHTCRCCGFTHPGISA